MTGGLGLRLKGWYDEGWGTGMERGWQAVEGGPTGTGLWFFSSTQFLSLPESAPPSPDCSLSPQTPPGPDECLCSGVQTFLKDAFFFLQQARASGFRGPCLSVGFSQPMGSPLQLSPLWPFKVVTGGRGLVTHTHPNIGMVGRKLNNFQLNV